MEMHDDMNPPQQKSLIPSTNARVSKFLLFFCSLCFFFFGTALLSIGMYVQLDHGFMSEIIGSSIYLAASYLCIVGGFLIIFVTFMGAWGSHKESKSLLTCFLVILIVLTLLILVGGFMAILFRTSMIEAAKNSMKFSITHYYAKKRLVSEAWDLMQTKLRCCGVDNNGWAAYNNSYWDGLTNADVLIKTQKLPPWSPFYRYVPESCCYKLFNTRTLWPSATTRNLAQCQYWPYGPPNYQTGGFNEAVYYRGCYEAGAEFLSFHGRFLAGIGLFLFFIMVAAIICAFIMVVNIDPEMREARKKAKYGYMMPGYPHPGMARGHYS